MNSQVASRMFKQVAWRQVKLGDRLGGVPPHREHHSFTSLALAIRIEEVVMPRHQVPAANLDSVERSGDETPVKTIHTKVHSKLLNLCPCSRIRRRAQSPAALARSTNLAPIAQQQPQ
eukprot:scaffold80108_cov47-Phaeocystis_antarctica.AAC.1